MAEERMPGDANNIGQQQQGKSPHRIRKGNLTELMIPARPGVRVAQDHRHTRSSNFTTSNPEGVPSSKQGEREPRVRTTKDNNTSKNQEEVGKVPAAKKNSKLLGRIFGLSVCFGARVENSEQRNQSTKKKTSAKTKKTNFTALNPKGKRESKKGAGARPAGLKPSETVQRDASRTSYDYSSTSKRNSSANNSENGTFRSWSRTSSARKSVSRLRDYYIQVMLNLADVSSQQGSGMGMGLGAHIDSDSRSFESEIFRKRSAQEADMVGHYFQNSIRPDEWNDAKMGNRVAKHFSV